MLSPPAGRNVNSVRGWRRQPSCGNNFTVYSRIKVPCCTPHTHIFRVSDISVKLPEPVKSPGFPGFPVVRTSPSIAGAARSSPSRGAKIPQASRTKVNHVRQKQSCRKFSKDLEMVHRGGGGPFKKKGPAAFSGPPAGGALRVCRSQPRRGRLAGGFPSADPGPCDRSASALRGDGLRPGRVRPPSRRTSAAPTPAPSRVKASAVVSFQPSAVTGRSLLRRSSPFTRVCEPSFVLSLVHFHSCQRDSRSSAAPAASESLRRGPDAEGLLACFSVEDNRFTILWWLLPNIDVNGLRHTRVPSVPPPSPQGALG